MKNKEIKKCSVCSNTGKIILHDGILYCSKHYGQILVYGKILLRTKFDKNEILIFEDRAEIILYKNNKENGRAIIDVEDVEKIKDFKWHLTKGNYARSAKLKTSLHNFILGFHSTRTEVIDHINRNRLDCRKNNLRIVTYQINGINKGKQSNNTSGYVGVSYDKDRDKYAPHIKVNHRKIFLGRFDTIEEALLERKKAEIKYFGEEINRDNDINTIFKKDE